MFWTPQMGVSQQLQGSARPSRRLSLHEVAFNGYALMHWWLTINQSSQRD